MKKEGKTKKKIYLFEKMPGGGGGGAKGNLECKFFLDGSPKVSSIFQQRYFNTKS